MKKIVLSAIVFLLLAGAAIAGRNIDCTSVGVPGITSSLTAIAGQNVPWHYLIRGSSSPTSFNATGLPNGLTVNTTTGLISGTPTDLGTSNITLTVSNSYGTSTGTLVLTVGALPVITSSSTSPDQMQGDPLDYTITATNSPTLFQASRWAALNPATGAIHYATNACTPGVYVTQIYAKNTYGYGTGTWTFTCVSGAPVISSSLSASGVVGSAFTYNTTVSNATVTARNVTAWAATGLPAGLSINTSTGVITGTPTTAGTSTVVLKATNTYGSGTANLVLSISSGASTPAITSSLTKACVQGTACSYTITASGIPTSFFASNMPGGMSLNTSSGVISGTPTVSGTINTTVSATNAFGSGAAIVAFQITPSGALTDPIPDTRKYTASGELSGWLYTGVPGGIPARTTICSTLTPSASTSAIQTAYNACPSGQTVFLSGTGTYGTAGSTLNLNKSGVTIRGNGPNNTRFPDMNITLGNGTTLTSSISNVTAGGSKGTKTITLASVSGLSAGTVFEVDMADPAGLMGNGPTANGTRNIMQANAVVSIAGNVVTVRNPWVFDFTSANTAKTRGYYATPMVSQTGIEGIGINHAASSNGYKINILGCDSCWVKGSESSNTNTYHLVGGQSLNIELRENFFHDGGVGNNNSAFNSYGSATYGINSNWKIENNIFNKAFPAVEINNFSNGFYVGYNYNNGSQAQYGGAQLVTWAYDDGHAPFNIMNLYEGNIGETFGADNYYGGAAYGTVLRNHFSGWNKNFNVYGDVIWLDAFAYNYNLVGNVLGSTQMAPAYFTTEGNYAAACDGRTIYRLGMPNLGNCDVVRWAPDCTKNTTYGSSLYTEVAGTPADNQCAGTTGSTTQTNGGYPDPHVDDTLMRWGNYDYFTKDLVTTPWLTANLGGVTTPPDHSIIRSYVYASTPSWWKSGIAWPPIGPDVTGGNGDTNGFVNKTPAQVCWETQFLFSSGAAGGTFTGSSCFQ